MDLNRVRDLVDPETDRVYSNDLIELEMNEKLATDGPYVVTREGIDLRWAFPSMIASPSHAC